MNINTTTLDPFKFIHLSSLKVSTRELVDAYTHANRDSKERLEKNVCLYFVINYLKGNISLFKSQTINIEFLYFTLVSLKVFFFFCSDENREFLDNVPLPPAKEQNV